MTKGNSIENLVGNRPHPKGQAGRLNFAIAKSDYDLACLEPGPGLLYARFSKDTVSVKMTKAKGHFLR